MSVEEADGILYTEIKVNANETMNVAYPTVLKSRYVRAAHIYNIIFSHIRQNFAIAGFASSIQVQIKITGIFLLFSAANDLNHFELINFQETLQFDGVYFQKLMEKFEQMNNGERDIFITPIKKYRIYA